MSFGNNKQSRRTFVRTAASAVAGAAAASARVVRAAEAVAISDGYIDVHVHLAQRWFGNEHGPLTVRHLLHWMDAHGIAQAAVLPLVSPESFWYPVTTEFVLNETREFRDRLIPFCSIDPRTLDTHLSVQQAIDMLHRFRESGARGFGEHKPKLPIDDPLNMKLYEACNEVRLPVLFHLDNFANMDRPGLPGLEKVLAAFPDLAMIGHGKGWWASIAGGLEQADLHVGYPRGPVAPGGAIDRLMEKHPNLYGDLSSSGAHAMLRDREFGGQFLRRRSDRLLFGTDYYDLTQTEFAHFRLLAEFDLPQDIERKIAQGNAAQLLDL